MTMVARELFVDTNILVYATNILSPWHTPATKTLETFKQSGTDLIVSPQILREYLAVMTRMTATGIGLPVTEILQNFQTFQTQFKVLEDNRLVLIKLSALLQQFSAAGKQIHDTNIVATMQAYNIPELLTHNISDFTRFASVITIVPLQ
jgi:predicted nucleic acid-binding protein